MFKLICYTYQRGPRFGNAFFVYSDTSLASRWPSHNWVVHVNRCSVVWFAVFLYLFDLHQPGSWLWYKFFLPCPWCNIKSLIRTIFMPFYLSFQTILKNKPNPNNRPMRCIILCSNSILCLQLQNKAVTVIPCPSLHCFPSIHLGCMETEGEVSMLVVQV